MTRFTLNGRPAESAAPPDAMLLWVLRDEMGLTGTKFGCGAGLCGACTVHVDGFATTSCVTPLSSIEGTAITTIEGLSDDGSHPLQRAWVAEEVPQCGYCQSGQIMRAAELLAQTPRPGREAIRDHMSANLCRCGTYARILRAVERAAEEA